MFFSRLNSAVNSDKIYMFGGYVENGAVNVTELRYFNSATQTITTIAATGGNLFTRSSGHLANIDKSLIGFTINGINNLADVKKFNVGDNTSSILANTSTDITSLDWVTERIKRNVYGFCTNTTNKFNADTVSASTQSATTASLTHATCSNINNEIFLYQSYSSGFSYSTVIGKFNETTYSAVSNYSTGRQNASAASLNGNSYFFGGRKGANDGGSPINYNWTNYSDIQKFNGSTNSVESATLSSVISSTSADAVSNSCYIFGGQYIYKATTNASSWTYNFYSTIQKYDGTTRSTVSGSIGTACAFIPTGVVTSYT